MRRKDPTHRLPDASHQIRPHRTPIHDRGQVVIEWTLSFGAITVVVSYCLSEIFKQRAQISVMKSEIGELNEMRASATNGTL